MELMIVVAIIGIISSIAIPSFSRYQNRSKFAEAYTNLRALASAQEAGAAVNGEYMATSTSWPGGGLGKAKRDSSIMKQKFGSIGWAPEGDVYFDYDTATAVSAGTNCAVYPTAYTATAYGDVDGNGYVSLVKYVHPGDEGDPVNSSCDSLIDFGAKGVAVNVIPADENGTLLVNQVVRIMGSDPF